MSTARATTVLCKTVSEVLNVQASFAPYLRSGEVVNGTPVVADEDSNGDLTFSNISISVGALDVEGVSVPLGQVVLYRATGGTVANSTYNVSVEVTTDAGQTRRLLVTMEVIADS